VGSRYAREDKKKGIFGYKRFLFPLIKLVCSSSMSSSVPHKIAAREEAVPVPFRHSFCRHEADFALQAHV